MKEKLLSNKQHFQDIGLVLVASLILAVGYTLFIVPHNIVPGGILGLSLIINELTGFSIGTIALAINIPLLLWGTKFLGKNVGIKTAVAMVSISVFIDTISFFMKDRVLIHDVLVSTIFGGCLIGLAVSMVLKTGATTGGNDIIVRVLSKKFPIPFGKFLLIIDGIIVLLGVIVFGNFDLAAYCFIAIIAISKTIDFMIKETNSTITTIVFSENNAKIQSVIEGSKGSKIEHIHHDSDKKMIIIVPNNKALIRLEQLVKTTDNKAYLLSLSTSKMT